MKKSHQKNNIINTLPLSRSKYLLLIVFALLFSATAFSLEPDSLKMDLRPQITILTDYDDNVNLVNENDIDYLSEGMLHLMPRFGLSRERENTFYGLAFDSDFRKGFSSAPFKSNLQTSGLVNLNFNNGLGISLSDYFMHNEFDLAFENLPGLTERQMNNFNSKISYDPNSKLNLYVSYGNRWNTQLNNSFRYKRLSNVFGGGIAYKFSKRAGLSIDYKNTQDKFDQTDSIRKRTLHNLNTKLYFPITKSLGTYIKYDLEIQQSPEIIYRNYTDNRTVAGFDWTGRNRLKFWIEGGYQSIEFESVFLKNYYGFVGMAGMDLKITEVFSTKLAAGIDGYSNFIFDATVRYQYSDKTSINLLASRKSQPYFYSNSPYAYYSAFNYQAYVMSKFLEVFQIKLGGSFQTRDDFSDDFDFPTAGNISQTSKAYATLEIKPIDKLYINLTGSYLVLKNDAKSYNIYQYDTWIGSVLVNYTFSKWGNIGGHFNYASRIATNDIYAYDNTRFGLFFKLMF